MLSGSLSHGWPLENHMLKVGLIRVRSSSVPHISERPDRIVAGSRSIGLGPNSFTDPERSAEPLHILRSFSPMCVSRSTQVNYPSDD